MKVTRLLPKILLLSLLGALPILTWAIATQRLDLRQFAVTPGFRCTPPPKCAYDDPPCQYAVAGVRYCPIKPTPTPTCTSPPACAYADPPCQYAVADTRYCPLKPTPLKPTPTPTCIPRLPCMDPPPGQPKCYPDIPPDGWFCPARPTPTPTCTPPPPCAYYSSPCQYAVAGVRYCPLKPTPTPTCSELPPCAYADPPCRYELMGIRYCPPPLSPTPTCTPPPPCAYYDPPCQYAVRGVRYCPIPPITSCVGKPNGTSCVIFQCDLCALPVSSSIEDQIRCNCRKTPGVCQNNVCRPITPTKTPTPFPTHTPTPTCTPPPPCAYYSPPCQYAVAGVRYCPLKPTPTPTPKPKPTSTPTPTTYPTGYPVAELSFDVTLRFAGVTDAKAEGAKVSIRFIKGALDLITPPIPVVHTGGGAYAARFKASTSELAPGPGYTMIVKGEKHIARKFCKLSGQTTQCQPYETFTIPAPQAGTTGVIHFDFTNLPLDPGDLKPQDGKADAADFEKIKSRMNISCSQLSEDDKLTADLDYNGCVNVLDAFLIRKTLETRYDEN